MQHRIESKPAFRAVGYTLRTTTVGGENMRAIPAFWGRCHGDGRVKSIAPLAREFGMLGLCADFDAKMEAFTYVIGVPATPGMALPPGTEAITVPAATYAVFGCVGAMPEGIQNGWHFIMGEWFPKSPYVQASPVNFELYPGFPDGDERGDPDSPNCYSEIWIPIREK